MCFKITAAQREYYRYVGVSADLERRGLGCSGPEYAWANRFKPQEIEAHSDKLWGNAVASAARKSDEAPQ